MGRRVSAAAGKSGRTAAGHVRDEKIDRIGPVTIYRRGDTYYLYYSEDGERKRPKIEGKLTVAKATAADVAKALTEERPSPLGTRSQDEGGNPLVIQQITGHRSMGMLKRYTHFDMQAKRTAMEAFHSRFAEKESGNDSED